MTDAGNGTDVVVVGAGLSGLVAAQRLEATGRRVTIVDKGRSVGGRLATRRIGGARLDHGAQFFTVRSDSFEATVRQLVDDGVAYEWCRGFDEPPDGHPRYACRAGMNAFAKWLAAGVSGPIHLQTEIDAIATGPSGVRVHVGDAVVAEATTAVVTAPVPQTLRLLDRGAVDLDAHNASTLRDVRYFATLALLTTLDRPPVVSAPGAEQHDDGPFTFVADNQRKGISAEPALTAQADHAYSLRRYDDDPREVLTELLQLARPWIGDARIGEAQLKKWRYAGPVQPVAERVLVQETAGGRLIFAGDAFGGPKVEGAFLSGAAAADAVSAG